MTQWLRTLAILAENQGSDPRTHIRQLKPPVTPVPHTLSGLHVGMGIHVVYIHTYTQAHTSKININKSF